MCRLIRDNKIALSIVMCRRHGWFAYDKFGKSYQILIKLDGDN